LTDVPWRLFYLFSGTVLVHTEVFCQFWNYIATILDVIGLHLMALGSIERYLLVFHHVFLARHRFILSTLPMLICIIYLSIFYDATIYGSSWCTYKVDYSVLACGPPCYLIESYFYPLFGILAHHVLPIFITAIANVVLLIAIAILQQKAKMKRNNRWRKNLRISCQLLSIALLYLIVWLPICILFLLLSLAHGDLQVRAELLVYVH
jgi:hypothetical protein